MKNKSPFLFKHHNYWILCVGLLLLVFGFLLMTGGGGLTDSDFNPDIFSTRRIIISPIIIIMGYLVILFSIFYND